MVGLGSIAPYFVRALDAHPDTSLAAVCDVSMSARARYSRYGVPVFADVADLLRADVVDAVVLTLPNNMHYPVAAAALRHGVPVCCEKPLTITPGDAANLVALSHATHTVLFTAFHRRYNENLRALSAGLRRAGPIARVNCRYLENIGEHTGGDAWYFDRERCGGGCVIDNGPNALDAVRSLFGQLQLTDATLSDVRNGVEFKAWLRLRTQAGVPVDVELDWALPSGEVKEVAVTLEDGRTVVGDMLAGFPGFKHSLAHEYAGIVTDFAAAVHTGGVHGEEGASIVELVDEAYRISGQSQPPP
ncbi:MAG: Gfo/Idh/MocA family oxidoreductase [Nocardioides sp.]|uniref:Gfo/Idh/MocA family protein n=1 Tax=Nocardioides sp. TaxID=35761 RepID=UPI0039E44876